MPELAGDYNPMLGEDHMDRITRVEARLVETSIVPTPAYADAQVTLGPRLPPPAARPTDPDARGLETLSPLTCRANIPG